MFVTKKLQNSVYFALSLKVYDPEGVPLIIPKNLCLRSDTLSSHAIRFCHSTSIFFSCWKCEYCIPSIYRPIDLTSSFKSFRNNHLYTLYGGSLAIIFLIFLPLSCFRYCNKKSLIGKLLLTSIKFQPCLLVTSTYSAKTLRLVIIWRS